MSDADLEFLLPGQRRGEGIRERDFQAWKHHPVSKVILRFFEDSAQHVRKSQIDLLNGAKSSPDQFLLGIYNGRFNAFAEMANLAFGDLANAYPIEDEAKEEDNAA